MAGALDGLGYGRALGRFILKTASRFPRRKTLAGPIATEPAHPLTAARADLLRAIASSTGLAGGSPSSTGGSTRRSWPRRTGTAFR